MTNFGICEQVYLISEALRRRFGELSLSQRLRLRRVCEKYATTQAAVFAEQAAREAQTIYGFLDRLQELLDQYGIRDGAEL